MRAPGLMFSLRPDLRAMWCFAMWWRLNILPCCFDEEKFRESLSALGIAFSSTSLESAQLAGRIFKDYRREGGPREHLIPDFLIGAHAQTQADRIAAVDRGYLRRYFPRLRILKPS